MTYIITYKYTTKKRISVDKHAQTKNYVDCEIEV